MFLSFKHNKIILHYHDFQYNYTLLNTICPNNFISVSNFPKRELCSIMCMYEYDRRSPVP